MTQEGEKLDAQEWAAVLRSMPHIQVRRESLEKAVDDDQFNKLMTGCFVRVVVMVQFENSKNAVGRVGRIEAALDEKDGEEIYEMPNGEKSSRKFRILYDGKTKFVKLHEISDREFSKDELRTWKVSCEKNNMDPPSLNFFKEKRQSFRDFIEAKRKAAMGIEAAVKRAKLEEESELHQPVSPPPVPAAASEEGLPRPPLPGFHDNIKVEESANDEAPETDA